MKVGNVSFGIRYDRSTFNVLTNAKLNGLNTEKLEENLADLRTVAPEKTLLTEHVFQDSKKVYTMYVANSKADDKLDRRYILPPKYWFDDMQPRIVDQSLIDEITKNLQELKKELIPQAYLTDKNMVEKELIEKLGEPIS